MTEYIPIIYIFDSYYEVWGLGIRYGQYGTYPNYTLAKYCKATSIPLIWHCEKRLNVLYELFRRFRQYGASKARICRFNSEWICKEIEL